MCNPGAIIAGISAVMTVAGQYQQSKQQERGYSQQRQIFEYNAQVSENNAIAAEQQALHQADMLEERFKRVRASQDPAFAKSGVLINQDTPLSLSIDTTVAGALERNAVLHSGGTSASASLAEAAQRRFQARTASINASGALTGGYTKAGASLLSNANTYYWRGNPGFIKE